MKCTIMAKRIWETLQGQVVPDSFFKYKVLSVKHLDELQTDFNTLDSTSKISHNAVFRSYIKTMIHDIPESFPDAVSVVVMAIFTPLMVVDFHYKGDKHEVLLPHYYDIGVTEEQLQNTVLNRIIGKPGYHAENAKMHVLLKRLAVRSGLGKYGRNNLCYVDSMGSLVKLFAYFTDFQFEEDDWMEVRMMDSCTSCTTCMSQCPTGAISGEDFVVNIERCIPLYNEIQGQFPVWLSSSSHNALMGCLHCQLSCPANSQVISNVQRLCAISEEETEKILQGKPDENLLHSLSSKLRMFPPEAAPYYFPVIRRNLQVLIGI